MSTESYRFRDYYIPERMLPALHRYVERGIRPGNFLEGVLAHDLMEACQRADDENINQLPAYAAYMYNELPSDCHGSYTIVERWVARGGQQHGTESAA